MPFLYSVLMSISPTIAVPKVLEADNSCAVFFVKDMTMTHPHVVLSSQWSFDGSPALLSAAMVRQFPVFRRTEDTLAARNVAMALARPWNVTLLQWSGDALIAPRWSPDEGVLAASSADLSRRLLVLLFGAWDGTSAQELAPSVTPSVERASCAGLEVSELDWTDWVDCHDAGFRGAAVGNGI